MSISNSISNSISSIPKRYVTLLVLTCVSVLLLSQFKYFSVSSSFGHSQQTARPVAFDKGITIWTHRQPDFPLDSYKALPAGRPKKLPPVQHRFASESNAVRDLRLQRRDQVKTVFAKCWSSYKSKAWMYDELSPISGKGLNTFSGWAASLVDALDTLWVMDMKDDFHEAVLAVDAINFNTSTDATVNIFETNIRYLGGFLGAYDLSGDVRLLSRAADVGDMLIVAFDTPNHFPITRWDWQAAARGDRQDTPTSQLVSELGSLSLEFTRLTQLTRDPRFFDAIQRITELFDTQQSLTKLPGMWPVMVNPKLELLTDHTGFTLGGMSDSLYEYLPKQYALMGGLDNTYKKLYDGSMKTAIEALFFRPMTPTEDDILITGDARASGDGKSYVSEARGQHLGCFVGGMLGLGGRLFENNEHVILGQKLTEGCIWAYDAMERGLMPEIAHFVPCKSRTDCPWDEQAWLAEVLERAKPSETDDNAYDIVKRYNLPKGYTKFDDSRYILRPEAIESVFIMYRITGDEKYREAAWNMFTAINEISSTTLANAAIRDVTTSPPDEASKDDRMESFWLAETLKYFYLIFSEPELVNLDHFVFNTEAHPLRRPL